MTRHHHGSVASCLLLVGASLAALAPRPGLAQDSSGFIEGTIFDSVSAQPLAGADVFVWNTSYRTTTDHGGAFRFDGIPPGEHQLVFVHDLLLELGISTGNQSVLVSPGEGVFVDLATPSAFTILTNTCVLEGLDSDAAVAVGFVGDDDSGVAMPGARVHLTWYDELGSPHTMEAVSNALGWYRFCQVPAGVRLGARAFFLNRLAARQEVMLAPGEQRWMRFQVADLESGSVSGKLVDQDRGWAIEEAEVRLLGTEHRTVSGDGGNFRFSSVEPGEYTLEVTHLAYGTRSDPLNVGSAMAVNVEVAMSVEPIALDPIQVTVQSIVDLDGVVAGGRLVSRDDVERVRHRARDLADVLRLQHLSEVVVRRGASGELCVGITTGQVRLFKRECSNAIFYIDNARVSSSDLVLNMSAMDIDRIVVYRPVEAGNLFGLGSGNGVIVIYTKSGQRKR